MLGTLAASGVLETDRYDRAMMMCLLAQLRTTGQLGFRGDCLFLKQLGREGWQHYFHRKDFVSYSPHMEAYLWACFLWAYQRTGYEMFYQRAENAIRMTMLSTPTAGDGPMAWRRSVPACCFPFGLASPRQRHSRAPPLAATCAEGLLALTAALRRYP